MNNKFLIDLMSAICPTGYEEEAASIWRTEAKSFADTWTDSHGNSFAAINKNKSNFKIMLAGHIDEIGLAISYINEKGFLYFNFLGGWDTQILPGQRINIKTKNGIVSGVIGRTPIHLIEDKQRSSAVKLEDLWIDIGAKDKEEALSLVEIGDPAVVDYGYKELRNDLVVARAFDDRIGSFVVLEALRLLSDMGYKDAAVYAVATSQEEIGTRGAITSAFDINPDVGVAVDVGFASDTPSLEGKKSKIGEVSLGKGPILARGPNINPKLPCHLDLINFYIVIITLVCLLLPCQIFLLLCKTGNPLNDDDKHLSCDVMRTFGIDIGGTNTGIDELRQRCNLTVMQRKPNVMLF